MLAAIFAEEIMSVSTSNQRVNQKRFNESHDRTFPKVRKPRPGKTTYVCENGQVVPKHSHWIMVIDPAAGPDYTSIIDINKRQLQALGK
jgi:hypothetical protein